MANRPIEIDLDEPQEIDLDAQPPVLDEEHPDVSKTQRFMAQNLTVDSKARAQYLKDQGFDAVAQGDKILVRKPGELQYRVLDSPKVTGADLTDIIGDIWTGTGSALGAVGAGLATAPSGPGAVAAAIGGAGAGGAAAEGIKLGVGKLLGMPGNAGDIGMKSLEEGAWGMAGEGAAKVIGKVGGGLLKGLSAPAEEAALKATLAQKGAAHGLSRAERAVATTAAEAPVAAERGAVKGEATALRESYQVADEAEIRAARANAKANFDELKFDYEKKLKAKSRARMTPTEEAIAAEKTGAKAATEAAESSIPNDIPYADQIAKILSTPEQQTKFRFVSALTHPAWGMKAKYLDKVPEFVEILNKHWPGMVDPLGSKAMVPRAAHLNRAATEIGQEAGDQKSLAFAQDVGKWMLSDERSTVIAGAREAAERLANGTGTIKDAAKAREFIFKAAELPEELQKAAEALRAATVAESRLQATKKTTAAGLVGRKQDLQGKKKALEQKIEEMRTGRLQNRQFGAKEALERAIAKKALVDKQTARPTDWIGEPAARLAGALPVVGPVVENAISPAAWALQRGGNRLINFEKKILPKFLTKNGSFARRMVTQPFASFASE